jgi:hypothetical protein
MALEIPRSAFRHLLRVRIGATGPRGRLYKCTTRDGSRRYWKVKLASGAWVWPHGLIIDGLGDHVSTCAECESPFMSKRPEVLCSTCDELLFGTQQRASEPPDTTITERDWHRRHSR